VVGPALKYMRLYFYKCLREASACPWEYLPVELQSVMVATRCSMHARTVACTVVFQNAVTPLCCYMINSYFRFLTQPNFKYIPLYL
jgi:hypothetical protein